jgi:hypothetical protein
MSSFRRIRFRASIATATAASVLIVLGIASEFWQFGLRWTSRPHIEHQAHFVHGMFAYDREECLNCTLEIEPCLLNVFGSKTMCWFSDYSRWKPVLHTYRGTRSAVLQVSEFGVSMPLWPTVPILVVALWTMWQHCPFGKNTCGNCGYALRGLNDNQCPECGTSFGPVQ